MRVYIFYIFNILRSTYSGESRFSDSWDWFLQVPITGVEYNDNIDHETYVCIYSHMDIDRYTVRLYAAHNIIELRGKRNNWFVLNLKAHVLAKCRPEVSYVPGDESRTGMDVANKRRILFPPQPPQLYSVKTDWAWRKRKEWKIHTHTHTKYIYGTRCAHIYLDCIRRPVAQLCPFAVFVRTW